MLKKLACITLCILFIAISFTRADPVFREIRTASDRVIVAFFTSDTVDPDEILIEDLSQWKINGKSPTSMYRYAMQADACDHHIYLETDPLVEDREYRVETPYGTRSFTFHEREIFCLSLIHI